MATEYGELKLVEDIGWTFYAYLHDLGKTDVYYVYLHDQEGKTDTFDGVGPDPSDSWADYLEALNKLAEDGWELVTESTNPETGDPVRFLMVRDRPGRLTASGER